MNAQPDSRGRLHFFWQETRIQLYRWFKHFSREPFSMLFSLMQPLIWLIFFSSIFQKMASPAVTARGAPDYRTFMTPAVIVMTVFGSTMMAGIPILFDRETGVLQKVLVAPISRASIMVSRVLYTAVVTVLQIMLILGVAMMMGVRVQTGVPGILFLTLIGLALGFGLTVISLALALKMRQHGDFFAITGFLTLPILFLSSAFAPIEFMPLWMQLIARFNPITFTVDGIRNLMVSGWDWTLLVNSFLALVAFDVLCFFFGLRAFRKGLA